MKVKHTTRLKIQALIHDLMTFRIMDGSANEISGKYQMSCEHLHELKRRGMVIYDKQNRTIEWIGGHTDINHLTEILLRRYQITHESSKEKVKMKALPSLNWWQRITNKVKQWSR
jgi:hypothetical protein